MAEGKVEFVQVQTSGEVPRLRKSHPKSRKGCDGCRSRKIKCDERLPQCSSCERRGWPCIRPRPSHTARKDAPPDVDTEGDQLSPAPHAEINVGAIHMFHHFEHSTIDTLAFGGRIWRDLLPSAFEEHYLLHAIISIAAAHRQSCEKKDVATLRRLGLNSQITALHRLSQAVPGLPGGEIPSDALVGSLVLLYHHSWAVFDREDAGGGAVGRASLLPEAGPAFREMIQGAIFSGPSLWHESLAYSPKVGLQLFVMHTPLDAELEAFFERQFRELCPDEGAEGWRHQTFMAQCERLIPLLAVLVLRERSGRSIESIRASVVRYAFTWPLLCSPGFLAMQQQGDFLADVVELHFFTAVARIDMDSMWWARGRAEFARRQGREKLARVGVEVADVLEAASATAHSNASTPASGLAGETVLRER